MLRTQISLTEAQRRALDTQAAHTGRSISALIRDAVDAAYGTRRSSDDDLVTMRQAFGVWRDHDADGATWVEKRRSGARLAQHSS